VTSLVGCIGEILVVGTSVGMIRRVGLLVGACVEEDNIICPVISGCSSQI
jgi:hypothetical protein